MEKARLEQDQAEALRLLLEEDKWTKSEIIERHTSITKWRDGIYFSLNGLEIDTLCQALYVGYDILEPDQTIVVTESLRKEIQDAFSEKEILISDWGIGWRRGFKDALALLEIKA